MAIRLLPQTAYPAALTAVVLAQTSLVAPAGVMLGTTGRTGFSLSTAPGGTPYDPDFHEITYFWKRISGPTLAFEAGMPKNIVTAWKDPNLAYGPQVAFALNDSGTYTFEVFAVDRVGNAAVDTIDIVVADADTFYPTTKTIAFSESSNFTGAPSGATQVSSMTAVNSAIAALGASADVRVLCRGGETFSFTTQFNASGVNSLAVGSYGTGRANLPLLTYADSVTASLFRSATGKEVKVYDLNMTGAYDAANEIYKPAASPFWRSTFHHVFMHRCKVSGCSSINSMAIGGAYRFLMSEVEVTNWQNFGFFNYDYSTGSENYYAYIGCSAYQHVDAPQGYNDGRSLANAHGPMRQERSGYTYVGICDFFSRNGWSAGFGGTSDQPALRFNTNSWDGAMVVMDRVACEGGYTIINMSDAEGTNGDAPGNYVFDKMVTLATCETDQHVLDRFGGTTIRNWFGLWLNAPMYNYEGADDFVFYAMNIYSADNAASPQRVYSSTFINLLTTANARYSDPSAPANVALFNDPSAQFSDKLWENNVLHAPNQTTPVNASPALDMATALAGFTPRFKGVKASLAFKSTLAAAVANGATLAVPYTNILDESGAATTQAFWNARTSAGSTWHAILIRGTGTYYQADGQIAVTFGATTVNIQNLSGTSWPIGAAYDVKLDQHDVRTMNTTFDLTGITVPRADPNSGSTWSTGLIAEDDFLGVKRPGRYAQGAPAGTPAVGAMEPV